MENKSDKTLRIVCSIFAILFTISVIIAVMASVLEVIGIIKLGWLFWLPLFIVIGIGLIILLIFIIDSIYWLSKLKQLDKEIICLSKELDAENSKQKETK